MTCRGLFTSCIDDNCRWFYKERPEDAECGAYGAAPEGTFVGFELIADLAASEPTGGTQ